MNTPFKEAYEKLQNPMPSLPLYGLGEIVSYGGHRWEITAFEPNEKDGCWVYDLKRVDGTDESKDGINELGIGKSYRVEKPGSSVHTSKWDRCVEHVEQNSDGVNAYAVCTAMLGNDSFKSMDDVGFEEKIKYYMEKLGIAGAGPIPNSLLAEQDLEGETLTGKMIQKSSLDFNNFAVWYYDPSGAQKCAVFGNYTDAEAYAQILDAMEFKDIKIMKTGTEETEMEPKEKNSLVENIKANQIRRQKASMRDRAKNTTKSFKQVWNSIKK